MKPRVVATVVLLVPVLAFAADAKNLLKATNKIDSWTFFTHEGGKGSISAADEAIVFKVEAVTGTEWHVQAYQVGLDLKNGQEYVVKFQAKGGENRTAILVAMINKEDWHEIGLHEEISLTKEFKSFEFTFRAQDVAEKMNRIGFELASEKGTVVVKDMTLTEKK